MVSPHGTGIGGHAGLATPPLSPTQEEDICVSQMSDTKLFNNEIDIDIRHQEMLNANPFCFDSQHTPLTLEANELRRQHTVALPTS